MNSKKCELIDRITLYSKILESSDKDSFLEVCHGPEIIEKPIIAEACVDDKILNLTNQFGTFTIAPTTIISEKDYYESEWETVTNKSYNKKKHSEPIYDDFIANAETNIIAKINSKKYAKKILFDNEYTEQLCDLLVKYKLESLIAGSYGLACLHPNATYKPNDIDLYVKNIDSDKISTMDKIITTICGTKLKFIVVRTQLTVTWLLYDPKTNRLCTKIQINLLYINSWSEYFNICHSNIVCCGYEVLYDRFIYLKGRWEKLFTNKVHYFSDILNIDNRRTLDNAVVKYCERGFDCAPLYVENDVPENPLNFSGSQKNKLITSESELIVNHIIQTYVNLENIKFSNSGLSMYNDKNKVLMVDLWKLTDPLESEKHEHIRNFTNFVESIEFDSNKSDDVCPILLTYENVWFKNIKCMHKMSIKTYLTIIKNDGVSWCPLCRVHFVPDLLIE
jgi:hypothetical protein